MMYYLVILIQSDLLIIKLIQPELIVILLYRPPSCSGPQFEDVILKMKSVMFKLASPLPNIIMLGDFNLPTMSWSQPGDCFISRLFVRLSNHYFFNNMSIYLQGKIIYWIFYFVIVN